MREMEKWKGRNAKYRGVVVEERRSREGVEEGKFQVI